MESAFYRYYHISTDYIESAWDTREIETYLMNTGCFINEGKGSYKFTKTFMSLQLMMVKDYNSWSSNDYNSSKTNYIDIVTAKNVEPVVVQFFQEFEMFIGGHVIEETHEN